MVMQSSGTITLQQIYNDWVNTDNTFWIPIYGYSGGNFYAAHVSEYPPGTCPNPAYPSLTLFGYRGSWYWYDAGGTRGQGVFSTGTITIQQFYGKTNNPNAFNCACDCGGDCSNCDG